MDGIEVGVGGIGVAVGGSGLAVGGGIGVAVDKIKVGVRAGSVEAWPHTVSEKMIDISPNIWGSDFCMFNFLSLSCNQHQKKQSSLNQDLAFKMP